MGWLSKWTRKLDEHRKEPSFIDVSKRPGAQPLRFDGACPTVVAIHGFTGVPGEVQLCCDVAGREGLASVAPLLTGHGQSARELATTRYSDWLSSARTDFEHARRRGPVILVGMSLGALLATELTLQAPGDVAGLVLLSNAFWLSQPHPASSLRLASALRFRDRFIPKKGADLGDSGMLEEHVTLDAQPLHAAVEVELAGRRLRKELFRIHRPTLLVHGARDSVCPVSNSWRVAQDLGTTDTRVVVLPRSKHIVTRDVDRGQLEEELSRFYRRFAPQNS